MAKEPWTWIGHMTNVQLGYWSWTTMDIGHDMDKMDVENLVVGPFRLITKRIDHV